MIKRYSVKITGISPIRQSRRPEPGDHEMKNIGGRLPTKEEAKKMFENARYWEKKIGYYQPATQIKAALKNGAKGMGDRVPGQGKKTFTKFIGAAIMITPDKLVHKNQKDVKTAEHWTETDRGSQIWVVKPEIHDWELEFEIQNVMPEVITDSYLKKFLEYAGLYCGIGTDRPEKGKSFGRFEIKEFKELK